MKKKLRKIFKEIEDTWEIIPGYVKVFSYSIISVLVGAYLAGEHITVKTVVLIIATNLGLYQIPRTSSEAMKSFIKKR